MKSKNVISYKCLPSRAPTLLTAVAWLLMDRLGAPGLVQGAVSSVLSFMWLFWLLSILEEKQRKVPGFGDDQ